MRRTVVTMAVVATLVSTAAGAADEGLTGRCADEATAPATAPQPEAEATAPGNAGNTGWTGGTGGSHIGTSNQGATPHSPTWQPPTATGLDLAGVAGAPADC